MRKETGIEASVRKELDKLGIKCIQEFPVRIGKRRWSYHLDFFLVDINSAIEVDGEFWHRTPKQKARDNRKDKRLLNIGIRVFRIKEKEILENAKEAVYRAIKNLTKNT